MWGTCEHSCGQEQLKGHQTTRIVFRQTIETVTDPKHMALRLLHVGGTTRGMRGETPIVREWRENRGVRAAL